MLWCTRGYSSVNVVAGYVSVRLTDDKEILLLGRQILLKCAESLQATLKRAIKMMNLFA